MIHNNSNRVICRAACGTTLGRRRYGVARFLFCLSVVAWCGHANGQAGDDESPDSGSVETGKDAASNRRLEIMQAAIDDFEVTAPERETTPALKFVDSPLLRYSDQTRELTDAGVWRLGTTGRPAAIVTLEIYDRPNVGARLVYEFLSLSAQRFSVVSPRGPQWAPSGTDLKMADLPNSPPPAESKPARLIQMRRLARRFAAREEYRGDKVECRLLPQPVENYADPEAKIVDGAVFIFANGTNPEVGLLLECDAQT